jgi:hypothetical protein
MTELEALQHGLGYAAGREDGNDDQGTVKTAISFDAFARAYAAGWADYREGRRGFMTNCRDAYNTWQRTDGKTIFRDDAVLISEDKAEAARGDNWPADALMIRKPAR